MGRSIGLIDLPNGSLFLVVCLTTLGWHGELAVWRALFYIEKTRCLHPIWLLQIHVWIVFHSRLLTLWNRNPHMIGIELNRRILDTIGNRNKCLINALINLLISANNSIVSEKKEAIILSQLELELVVIVLHQFFRCRDGSIRNDVCVRVLEQIVVDSGG